MNIISRFLAVGLVVSLVFCAQADSPPASPTLSILKSVPLAELPSKAAELVAAAKVKDQAKITADVVKAAIGLNPAAAAAIVGAIAARTPAVAAIAAATAARLLPKQAAALAQIAATAAPKLAGKIVEAVCKAVPRDFLAIAEAVAAVVPGAAREILLGVAAALPALRNAITDILAHYKDKTLPSVSQLLREAASNTLQATQGSGLISQIAHTNSQSGPYVLRIESPITGGTPEVTGPLNYSKP